MHLLVNVLEQPEHLVAILEGFAKIGIKEKGVEKLEELAKLENKGDPTTPPNIWSGRD